MLRHQWDVLLVDDEPDILAVSKLALKHLSCFGIPIKIHECESKAAAIEFLQNSPHSGDVALALLDVVMETDQAGLELAQYIRQEMKNKSMQIYIRTGQAGKAPERDVLDRYDINGYLSKVEATDDRLYSILKSSLREYCWTVQLQTMLKATTDLITAATSHTSLLQAAREFFGSLGGKSTSLSNHCCFFIQDHIIGTGVYQDHVVARDRLEELLKKNQTDSVTLDYPGGSTVSIPVSSVLFENEREILIVPPSSSGGNLFTPVYFLWRSNFEPLPEFVLSMMTAYLNSFRILWQVVDGPMEFQFNRVFLGETKENMCNGHGPY